MAQKKVMHLTDHEILKLYRGAQQEAQAEEGQHAVEHGGLEREEREGEPAHGVGGFDEPLARQPGGATRRSRSQAPTETCYISPINSREDTRAASCSR